MATRANDLVYVNYLQLVIIIIILTCAADHDVITSPSMLALQILQCICIWHGIFIYDECVHVCAALILSNVVTRARALIICWCQ